MATTYKKIASVEVGAGGASGFDFTSIPQTYQDLAIWMSVRTSNAAVSESLTFTYNSNTSNRSSQRWYYLNGTGAAAQVNGELLGGQATGANATSGFFGVSILEIFDYADSSNFKTSHMTGIAPNNDTTNFMWMSATTRWLDTTAINRVTIVPADGGTIQQYSTAYLYGISNS